MKNRKPNIILINCDDLGYGDLGCYGSKLNNTPNIDQLAAEGILFTDFYMASPVCSPSRGAMMTGCYPPRIGFGSFNNQWVLFPGMGVGLNPAEKTIATILKQSGYASMIIGKWHCGDQSDFLPTRHGFDHYYGLPYSNDMGRQVGRSETTPLPLLLDEEVIEQQPDQSGLTERYLEKAVQYMTENEERPFFLYFAHMYVHLPIYVQERFMRNSQNGSYGAAVACIDWTVGVLLKKLQELGIDDKTMIVFTSDNGSRGDHGGSNGILRGSKGWTWEGGMRVPCIIRWPGKILPGRISNNIITAMDFLPTFTHITGGVLPDDRIIDGIDFSNILFDENAKPPRQIFFYYFRENLEAVRYGKWKLFVRRRNEEVKELYNLEEDIGETINLADSNHEVVQELLTMLARCRQDIGDKALGIQGQNCRPIGKVDNPIPLCVYDENYPYYMAEYDLADSG